MWTAVGFYDRFACVSCLNNLHDSRTEWAWGCIQSSLWVDVCISPKRDVRSGELVIYVYANILQPFLIKSDMIKRMFTQLRNTSQSTKYTHHQLFSMTTENIARDNNHVPNCIIQGSYIISMVSFKPLNNFQGIFSAISCNHICGLHV